MIGLKEQEKEGLIPVSSADAEARARQYQAEEKKRSGLKWLAAGLLTLVFLGSRLILLPALGDNVDLERSSGACAQPEALTPKSFDVSALVEGKDKQIISWLSDAVKVPTEIFDVMGPIGEDPRWDVFYKFADYLEKAFPLVHKHLVRTRVVTHALVFEWIGSDPSLKPLLLTGHQDVVPVLNATRGLWTHDPYGGEYDESTGLIWGRGSGDDKSGTIGALSAVELLLESGKFNPARTVILAFGIDEETGGKVGAYHLNEWIENKYGKDSIAMLVDEGSGTEDIYGQLYATPAVAEKGYLDVEIKVETLGGHSSVPPTHTGIGYLALLIAELEKNPHQPHISLDSPLVTLSSCMADYSPEAPSNLKRTIRRIEQSLNLKKGKVNHKAWKQLENWWLEGSWKDGVLVKGLGKAMITTTQAVDIISGGMKVNALPEVATAVVNHRINIASSPTELTHHLVDVLGPVARHHNLELVAFGKSIDLGGCSMKKAQPKAGKIVLSEAFNSWLETAPVSPHTVDSAAWRLLSGTVKSVYATRPEAKNETLAKKTIQMAPTYSTGNTDTKRYWGLTRNIYRFAYQVHPAGFVGFGNAHTVDEHIPAYTFIEEVRWFMNFIVNVDESREI